MRVRFILLLVVMVVLKGGLANGSELSLEEFLRQVQDQSLDLKIEHAKIEQSSANAQGLRLEAPMMGLMSMREGMSENRGFEISQSLPFPTKLLSESELRKVELHIQRSRYELAKVELIEQASRAYVEYWRAFEKKKILSKKKDWLSRHVVLSRGLARSDSSGQLHLLSLESQQDAAQNEEGIGVAELKDKEQALRAFVPNLSRDGFTPVLGLLTEISSTNLSERSAQFKTKQLEFELAEKFSELKGQSALPDLVLRYRSYQGNDMTPRSEELMVGLSLPFLFFWQPQAERGEARAKQEQAQQELSKTRIEIEARLRGLLERFKALRAQLENIETKLSPRMQRRIKLVENMSVRSIESLDERRMIMLDSFELEQNHLNLRADLEVLGFEILKLTSESESKK